jgi:hypothetical protein
MSSITPQNGIHGGCLRTPASLFSGALMSIKIMSQVWQNASVDGRRLLVLLAIADNCNDDGMCYPSNKHIARKTRQSERNVQYALSHLQKQGLIRCADDENGFRRIYMNLELIKEHANFAPPTQGCAEIDQPLRTPTQPLVKTIPALAPKPSITIKEPSITKTAVVIFEIPSWVPKECWEAFLDMRKQNKKPMTEHAKGLAIKKLEQLRDAGNAPDEVLNQSTMNCWQGLFELNGRSRKRNGSPTDAEIDAAKEFF